MLPYFPFERDDYALTMNARLLPLDRLIEIDPAHYRQQVDEKAAILDSDHRYYCQTPPATVAACWEALELLLPNLVRHYPDHFALDRDGAEWCWTNRLLGTTTAFTPGDAATLPLSPLDWLGRQVQEDLLIMDAAAPGVPLVAGQLCFAADWCLDDKLGRSFLAIHDPVPGFSDGRVGRSAALLMQRLRAGAPTGRIGWAFTADGTLNHAPRLAANWRDGAAPIDAANAGARCHLRLERQTFSCLPRTGALLFTIHTYVAPVEAVIAEEPDRARRLAGVVRTMPEEMRRYKGMAGFSAPLLAYLEAEVVDTPRSR
jgi:hypothetical protein